MKKLFLLDAYALIFRGYYAFIKNPRINSKGLDTSAIMGFMNSLLEIIRKEKPDHLAVAFDKGGSALRTEIYPEYKANRDETPEAIKIAIPYIHHILQAMHIPIIEKEGYEADDLIGTLAKKAEKQNYKVYMVTPDKDYAQLVSGNIFVYRPARMGNDVEIWGIDEVKGKFGVKNPEQVIDYLGMMGDAVDNIPGLPGVGEKTAKKLLEEFESMENLLANTDKLKGKMKEKIEGAKEQGLLSKALARILLDCPVEFIETDFELSQPNFEKVDEIFSELEFRQLKERIRNIFTKSEDTQDKEQKSTLKTKEFEVSQDGGLFSFDNQPYSTIETQPHLYQLIDSNLALDLLLEKLSYHKQVCFDTETTSIEADKAELVGIAFSFEENTAFYVPIPEDRNQAMEIVDKLKPFFENKNILKIGQNIKYDIKVLKNYGVEVQGFLFDTMIAHYLINPDMRHNLDVLSETYLNYSPVNIETLIGKKGKGQKSMREVNIMNVKEYACEDADVTLKLKNIFASKLKEDNTAKLFTEIESPLISVLADMETEGIKIDVEYLKNLSEELSKEAEDLQKRIYNIAGEEFNLASPKQLGDILFEKLKIGGAKPKKTKTGQYATGEEILSELAKENEIVRLIQEWRQIVKLQNTYVDALPTQINPKTERVHTEYMQAVAATGRLSSNNPNLQNIPIRTERGQKVRKAFVPRNETYTILSADYSQIELRIIAALSQEETMIEAFQKGEDIHRTTAAKVFDVPANEVTKEQRSNAKTVNFGIIYGVSAFGLSQQTNLNRTESKKLIDTYYETYPKLKQYIQKQIDFARENGYVQTLLGRRRYLNDINSQNAVVRSAAERNAVNAPIQGTAADIIKIAMINIHKKLQENNLKTKMLLQVHDELVFDVPNDEIEKVKELIKKEMETAVQLPIPLVVDIGLGNNWLEAH